MPEVTEATVIKNNETCINISLRRTGAGLAVTVKALSHVEEFFKANGDAGVRPVELIARTWASRDPNQPLQAYLSTEPFLPAKAATLDEADVFTIDAVGQTLKLADGKINLSFLRLVGISDPAGVSFDIRGVFSQQALSELREKLAKAARRFYIDYLRPVDVNITVSTQEIRL